MARLAHVRFAVQDYGAHPEFLEEHGRCDAGAPVGAVQDDLQSRSADGLGVHLPDHRIHVFLRGTSDAGDAADLMPPDGRDALMVEPLDAVLLLLRAFGPVGGYAFYPVEFGRVVGCGDHDPSRDIRALADVVLQGRRGDHPEVQDVRSDGHDPGAQRPFQHLGRCAGIGCDRDRSSEFDAYASAHTQSQFAVHVRIGNAADPVGSEHPPAHVIA